jgi:hypothetical protein
MNRNLAFCLGLLMSALVGASAAPVHAETYKMTTPIAPVVETPDTLETSIGTLKSNDGFPTAETQEKIWDNLDRSRALAASIVL